MFTFLAPTRYPGSPEEALKPQVMLLHGRLASLLQISAISSRHAGGEISNSIAQLYDYITDQLQVAEDEGTAIDLQGLREEGEALFGIAEGESPSEVCILDVLTIWNNAAIAYYCCVNMYEDRFGLTSNGQVQLGKRKMPVSDNESEGEDESHSNGTGGKTGYTSCSQQTSTNGSLRR